MIELDASASRRVLTLVGPAVADGLSAAMAALATSRCEVADVTWLCQDIACEIHFAAADASGVEPAVRARVGDMPLDFAVQPSDGRRKRLLVADMESTIITRELLDELGRLAGMAQPIAAITERAMRGEIEFGQALRERAALLRGLPAGLLDDAAGLIELTPGARTLVQTMRAHGAHAVLVSGGFDRFSPGVRAACGFDEDRANHLIVVDGYITGEVAEPILDRRGKRALLDELCRTRGLSRAAAAAVGDGANDIEMLAAAGLGVAFRGKAAVRAATRFHVDHTDLTTVLYFQGYRATEFRD